MILATVPMPLLLPKVWFKLTECNQKMHIDIWKEDQKSSHRKSMIWTSAEVILIFPEDIPPIHVCSFEHALTCSIFRAVK